MKDDNKDCDNDQKFLSHIYVLTSACELEKTEI